VFIRHLDRSFWSEEISSCTLCYRQPYKSMFRVIYWELLCDCCSHP